MSAIRFKHFSIMHFCYSQSRSAISLKPVCKGWGQLILKHYAGHTHIHKSCSVAEEHIFKDMMTLH